jgi:membrane AbrB-like protein
LAWLEGRWSCGLTDPSRAIGAILTAGIALLIGASGGLLFWVLHLPLPWTLGSLTAAAAAAIWFNRWPMPQPMRNLARPVVGVMAGAAFTPEIVSVIPMWWLAVLYIGTYSLLTSAIGYLLFTRVFQFDKVTAYFAATPGGLGEMSILGSALGGNMRTLVLVHSTRIVMIVFGIPVILQLIMGHPITRGSVAASAQTHGIADWAIIIAAGAVGYALGVFGRFPGGIMIAAMLCSALVHALGWTRAVPPAWLVALVQILIGSVAGARFGGLVWSELKTTALVAVTWSVVMLLGAVIAAKLGSWLIGRPFEPLLLAMTPGGTAEMIVITYALGADVAFVAACQLCRVFFVLTCAPLVFRLLRAPNQPHG